MNIDSESCFSCYKGKPLDCKVFRGGEDPERVLIHQRALNDVTLEPRRFYLFRKSVDNTCHLILGSRLQDIQERVEFFERDGLSIGVNEKKEVL
jgi:hypothetical protein